MIIFCFILPCILSLADEHKTYKSFSNGNNVVGNSKVNNKIDNKKVHENRLPETNKEHKDFSMYTSLEDLVYPSIIDIDKGNRKVHYYVTTEANLCNGKKLPMQFFITKVLHQESNPVPELIKTQAKKIRFCVEKNSITAFENYRNNFFYKLIRLIKLNEE